MSDEKGYGFKITDLLKVIFRVDLLEMELLEKLH
jgi:hypothetical protein